MTIAELHCISNYTFLRGASHPEELVQRAAELGYHALALTDECSFAGLVKAHVAARAHGLKLIVGAEFRLHDPQRDIPLHLILLAPHRVAYGQIATLITLSRRRAPKGTYETRLTDLRWCSDCLAIWLPAETETLLLQRQGAALKRLFNHLWIGLGLFRESSDNTRAARALALALKLSLRVVAVNDVHIHVRER
ncbi:MAG: PHP domain-containing protein, partial [Gammaproteobacteria bacterium]